MSLTRRQIGAAWSYGVSASATTIPLPSRTIQRGSLVKAVFRYEASNVALTVTDSAGGVWRVERHFQTNVNVAIAWCWNHPGGSNVVITGNLASSQSYRDGYAWEETGGDVCDPAIPESIVKTHGTAAAGMSHWVGSDPLADTIHVSGAYSSTAPTAAQTLIGSSSYSVVSCIRGQRLTRRFARHSFTGSGTSIAHISMAFRAPEAEYVALAKRRIWVPVDAGGAPAYASATSTSAFTVRGFAADSQAGAWSVRNHAASTRSAVFTVRSFASSSQAGAWSVRANVGASGAAAWSVRNHAAQTAPASYTVRNHTSATASAAFSVLAAGLVGATASAAFSVRNHTTASRSAAASVRNFTSASATAAFSVLASGIATGSGSAAWSVRNSATASSAAAFSVRNYASALQAGAWSVRSAVAATRSAAWSVKAYVYHSTTAAWSVDGDGDTSTWPTGRADPQHQAVVPFFGARAMVPAADVRLVVNFTGARAIVQQETP